MRLLDRYLLRELLVPLACCLCGFLIIWVAGDLLNSLSDFRDRKLMPLDIVVYYLLITPSFLVVVLPIGLLLALLYCLTNHARHHEITAIRAAGVSLWRLSLPYLGTGFAASLALFAVNEFWVPQSNAMADQIRSGRPGTLRRGQVRNLTFNNARDGRIWLIGLYDSDTATMTDPQLTWTLPDSTVRWLSAQQAVWSNNMWVFINLREFRERAHSNSHPVPILQTNVLAFPQFSESPDQIKSEIKLADSLNATIRRAKRADVPISELLDYLRLHPDPTPADRDWLYTKLHGRIAAPWTCVVVVLMAIPFGAASGRRNVFVGVASSIVICFAYFVLQQLCLALGTGGYLMPWLAAWLPNLCFGLTGLVLTLRVR